MVAKRRCLTDGSYTDHKVFDLGTPSQPRRKSQVGATLRLPVPGCGWGMARISKKMKFEGGGWGLGDKEDLTLNRVRKMVRDGWQEAGSVLSGGPVSTRTSLGSHSQTRGDTFHHSS